MPTAQETPVTNSQSNETIEYSFAELLGAPQPVTVQPDGLLKFIEAMHGSLSSQPIPPFRQNNGRWEILAPSSLATSDAPDAAPYEPAVLRPDGFALQQWANAAIGGEFPVNLRGKAEMEYVVRVIRNTLTSPVATEQARLTQQLITLNSHKESLHKHWLDENKDPAILLQEMQKNTKLAALCLNIEATERRINTLSRKTGASMQHALNDLLTSDLLISVNATLLALQGVLYGSLLQFDGIELHDQSRTPGGDAVRTLFLAVSESLLVGPEVIDEFSNTLLPGMPHLEASIRGAAGNLAAIHQQEVSAGESPHAASGVSAGIH